jgi:phage host-nuclease inhibitor protein Gam
MVAKIKSTITDYVELGRQFNRLAHCQASLLIQEAKMNKEILGVKSKYEKNIKITMEERNGLVNEIKLFCLENKKDFEGEVKSRKFLYGVVGFKVSSKGAIKILKKAKDGFKKAAKDFMELFGTKYVKLVPELEKDKISADYRSGVISDVILASVNLKFNKEPEFFYKFDFKKFEKETGIKVPVKKAVKGKE